MLDGITVGLVMSGDPKRRLLCERLAKMYRTYGFLDDVLLLYRKNPAFAFNEGSLALDTAVFIGIGGDVFVGESELARFVRHPGHVVFAAMYLDLGMRAQKDSYPAWWSEDASPFVSGLFRCNRRVLVENPMPTSPSFAEDHLWEKEMRHRVRFKGLHVPIVHIDKHSVLLRFRDLQWAAIAPERYRRRTLPGRVLNILAWRIPMEWRRPEEPDEEMPRSIIGRHLWKGR